MAASSAVTLLLVGYFSVCDGTVCSTLIRQSFNNNTSIYYTGYMYCSNYCCGQSSKRYCCTTSEKNILRLKYYGGALAIFLLFVFPCCGICCKCKTQQPSRRVFSPPPRPAMTSSGVSRGIEPGYGEKPITHYPMTALFKAKDPPLPHDSSDPAHPLEQSSNGGQINTRTLPPGTTRPSPSVPAPARQAPGTKF